MLENGQMLAARFVLLRSIGAGQWGEVWLARERDGGREFALKVLTPALAGQPELRVRFLAAARLQRSSRIQPYCAARRSSTPILVSPSWRMHRVEV
jgi:serine/threonine protein kinase